MVDVYILITEKVDKGMQLVEQVDSHDHVILVEHVYLEKHFCKMERKLELMILHLLRVVEVELKLHVIIELGVTLHILIIIVMIDVRNRGDDGLETRIR
jgi:hypothetical protein